MAPQFSVVIPSYNRAGFISATLESVFAQSHTAAEIIVVDDGSSDGTVAEVARHGKQVRLLPIANSGAAFARHHGVLASSATHIAFCDSDDLWAPDHLARLARLLATPDIEFCFSNFQHFGQSGTAQVSHFDADDAGFWRMPGRDLGDGLYIADNPLFEQVLAYQAIFPSCIAMSRAFYDRSGGFDPAFGRMVSEDLEFILRCVRNAGTGIDFQPTVGIRKHGDNHSADWLRCLSGSIAILKHSRQHHGLLPQWKDSIDRQIRQRSLEGIDQAFLQQRFVEIDGFNANLATSECTVKHRLKVAIGHLPYWLAQPLQRILTRGSQH